MEGKKCGLIDRPSWVWAWGLAIVMMMAAGAAWGQVEVEWERTYGAGTCYELVGSPEGGFCLLGGSSIVCLDANGDSLWARELGGQGQVSYRSLTRLVEGGYALAGNSADKFGLFLIDENGDSVLARSYNVSGSCNSVVRTADGGFLLAGYAALPAGRTSMFILRLDANCDSLWSNYIRPPGGERFVCTEAKCYSAIQISSGGFALAGYSRWIAEPGVSSHGPSFIVTNDPGEFILERSTEGYGSYEAVLETTNGDFVLAGSVSFYDPADDPTGFCLQQIRYDFGPFWSRAYEFEYSLESSIKCEDFQQLQDGGYLIAGTRWRWDGSDAEFVLMRTSAEGDSLWSSMLVEGMRKECRSIAQSSDGGFFLAGTLYDEDDRPSFYLVKTTPDPVSVPERPLTPYTLLLEPAFPNPFNSSTTIPFGLSPLANGSPTRIRIFDPLGRRIEEVLPMQTLNAGRHSVVWNAAGVPAGEYLIRLEAGGKSQVTSVQVVK